MPIPAAVGLALSFAKFVPDIIGLFDKKAGRDAEKVAGVVNGVAESLTGKQGKEALDVLENDPALALEFEKAVMANDIVKLELELEEVRLVLADRQDARSRDTQLKLAGHHNYRADVMLTLAFGCLCYLLYILNTQDNIPSEVLAIYNIIVGALLGAILDAFRFEFGSSRGSKEKDLLGGKE